MPTAREVIEARMADILNRDDFGARITVWFDRAYLDIQRRYDFKCMEVTEFLVGFAGMNEFPIPRDMKKSRHLYLADATTGAKLQGFRETSLEEIRKVWGCSQSCDPVFANWYETLLFAPEIGPGQVGQTLRFDYYRYLKPETDPNRTDWIMSHAEDFLVYRGLAESAPFLGADSRLVVWQQFAKEAFEVLWRADVSSSTYAPLVMRG